MSSWQVGFVELALAVRHRAINEQARPKQKARKLILTAGNSADTWRAAIARDSPSSEEEDVSTEVLGRSTELFAPKAQMPLEEALRPSGHRGRRAATVRMPAHESCLPSEQVPFDDMPSEQGPSAQEQFRVVPSALRPLESIPTGEGRDAKTRVPSAEAPSAEPDWEDVVGLPGAEILETKDDTPSEEEEVQSVQGTPTGVLCEQVVPLLWYLDRKVAKYGDPHQCGSYVELTDSSVEQIQIRNLEDELVRKTQALEQSEAAKRADEELLRRLQSQFDELRAQRAAAEEQLAEMEDHNRRTTDRTREELVLRVDRCLRGYARWEIAAQERMTLCELEMRATALMAGNGRSRRRVAKRLESILSRSRDAVANLEAEVTEVLRRLGLRRRADEWTGRELVGRRLAHRSHSR
ncbi:hypothetical protein AXG93_1544s1060 [Marchantia polymorpha subsp. ruderalis]|uniref:Uncharacterized protein n=1 Tax=Marchantia polymorpha subsp. ruderalis TaxID=1480154 RepID=A0A176VRW2_MARPO|nr:hypothetical protein AXG93_1544s1060 [Marchantia polymorpha subsp. ruderalis]